MHSKKNILYILFIALLHIHCKKNIEYTDDTYFGGKVMILGHHGMGDLYTRPGNTYESITPLMGIGADGPEIDIQLTRDTVLVLFHDHVMDNKSTCSGRIYDQDWADIKQCKYYALENMLFVNSADDLFSRLPNLNDIYFSFDCSKTDNDVSNVDLYRNQYLRAIKRICDKYSITNNVFIEGDNALLLKAQSLGMTNKLFLFDSLSVNAINIAKANNFFGVSTSLDWLGDNVSLAHEKGLYVMVWSPNNYSQNKEALNKKVDIIQTDDPISILKLLNRYNYEYIIP